MKQLKCRDAGFDCDAVVEGLTADDVMAQAGPHVRDTHGQEVTPAVAERIDGKIRDL